MCLVTHNRRTRVHGRTHKRTTIARANTALQQWEEIATVTNSFGATKVAGNLSNGTIKLQLSFFSFFYSRCMHLGGTCCKFDSEAVPGPLCICVCVCVSHCTSAWVYSRTVRVKFSRNNCNFSQEETALILLQLHHIVGGRKKIEFIPIVQKNKTAKIIALVFFTLPSSPFLFEISQDTQACSSICCCAYACYLFRISLTLFYNMLTNIFFFLSPYHCASVFRCVGVLKHPTSNTHSSLHAADLPGSLSVPPVG